MSRLLCVEAIRAIEHEALRHKPAGALMQQAADAVAAQAARLLRSLPPQTPVCALVGPGNNGGDALIAALRLRQHGFSVRAIAIAPPAARATDAQWAWRTAEQAGLRPAIVTDPAETTQAQQVQATLFIDGLFGIGLTRGLEGAALRWCQMLNAHRATVISIDVPSGIDADRGCVVGGARDAAIRATHTVTMIADKPGLHTGLALEHVGQLSIADLGLVADALPTNMASRKLVGELLVAAAVRSWVPLRYADSHKGRFGTVRIIGGASGMRGAALLAARAAQCMGAGRVAIEAPDSWLYDPAQPQLMAAAPGHSLADVDAVVIGCGLGRADWARQRLHEAVADNSALVIDADALNILADHGYGYRHEQALGRGGSTVVTPHPLEAARLLATEVQQIQSDRIAAARTLASRLQAVVVLKGAGSVIADPSGQWAISGAGDASLASAGTGDVLAGAIGALMAQGLTAWQAAGLAVWCHAKAGERFRVSQAPAAIGLSAAELPTLMRTVLNHFAWA